MSPQLTAVVADKGLEETGFILYSQGWQNYLLTILKQQ
jgi:hypothetical protein